MIFDIMVFKSLDPQTFVILDSIVYESRDRAIPDRLSPIKLAPVPQIPSQEGVGKISTKYYLSWTNRSLKAMLRDRSAPV